MKQPFIFETTFQFGLEWIKEAGNLIMSVFEHPRNIEKKGVIDLVTDADKASESLLINRILDKFPKHSILSEEAGYTTGSSEHQWIIDPIDGTTNYSRKLPFFCISIGYKVANQTQFGLIYAPAIQQLYYAKHQFGAYRNHQPIQVSKTETIQDAFLTTGFPYTLHSTEEHNNMPLFSYFSSHALAVRRLGSAALDLCYVADGIFDGYWEVSLQPWDFVAGELLVKEAGGKVSSFSGEEVPMSKSSIIASNQPVFLQMKEIIQRLC
ncbi:inositol monophosphatase [bacterium]|nr:inositol monophosphatase [bacterium]